MTYDGRVEALINVPAGASVTATTDAGTATVPLLQGSYFWTGAGGKTGLLAMLASQLNAGAPPRGYPNTPVAMNAAVGYGTWSAGWLCDETSGSLGAAFGPSALAPFGSPTYGAAGPRAGSDFAVGFPTSSDGFSDGNNFNPGLGDVGIAAVVKFSADTNSDIAGKYSGGAGGFLWVTEAGGYTSFYMNDSVTSSHAFVGGLPLNAWLVVMAVADRTANVIRIGFAPLSSGIAVVSATFSMASVGSVSNALNFQMGGTMAYGQGAGPTVGALYIASGAGAASFSANLSTAIQNLANAINARWTASLSTGPSGNGEVTLNATGGAIQPAWALAWSAASSLRDLSGFAGDVWSGYPRTAAEVATAIGYGTWTNGAGYLCDDASGGLAATFGSPALSTVNGSPSYGNAGPRGGVDKAVGFTTAADYFSGGNVFTVSSTQDLIVAWIAKWDSSAGSADFVGMGWGSGNGAWLVVRELGAMTFYVKDLAGLSFSVQASAQVGSWHAGIAVIERATGTIRITTTPLATGGTSTSANTSTPSLAAMTNAGLFALGSNSADLADINCKAAACYVVSGVGVATGVSANLSTALTNFAAMVGSRTGTKQARGLWMPDAPLICDGEPRRAPKVSDLRTTTSPTGSVLGLIGNTFYRQKNISWSHVPKNRVWEQAATIANSSWETFFNETQLGLGSTTWFTPASPIQIYDHTGTLVGADANSNTGLATGWQMTGVVGIEPVRAQGTNNWTGLFRIDLPEVASSG